MWDSIVGFFSMVAEWFADLIISLFQWILDGLEYLFVDLLILPIFNVLVDLVHAIPRPSFFTASFDAGVTGWLLDMMAVEYGVAILPAAYLIRFVIRRLPVIG